MGGISVLLGMGVLITLMILFIVIGIFIVIAYLFESIAIFSFRKNHGYKNNIISFIPCYNKYLYGKIADSKILGSIVSVISLSKLVCFILYFFYSNSLAFWLLIVFTIINFILNAVLSSRIYKKYSKQDVLFTILSIITFGVLRPIFIFAIRNNKEVV